MSYDMRSELQPEGQAIFDNLSPSLRNMFALAGPHVFTHLDDPVVRLSLKEGDAEKLVELARIYRNSQTSVMYQPSPPIWVRVVAILAIAAVGAWFYYS